MGGKKQMNEYQNGLWPYEGGIMDEEEIYQRRIEIEPPREPSSQQNLALKLDNPVEIKN
jgi:hypothetical protein